MVNAAKRTWILSDAFKLLSPARLVNWPDVLSVLAALARSA